MYPLPFEVSINFPLYQSKKGLYFIGQTPILDSTNKHALGILYNPPNSERLIYVNAISITNFSDANLSAEFYLRSAQDSGKRSDLITCTNTAISPVPIPNGIIEYISSPQEAPITGISIFTRIVPVNSTLVVDGGQIILGQTQSLSVSIGGILSADFNGVRIAFGWSEQEVHSHYRLYD